MNADSVYHIGSSHAVCQDYALAGADTEGLGPYAILSDGCSSSPDTDIGARLLARAAERALLESRGSPAPDLAETHREAAHLALSWAALLGLRPQAVDATLLTAHLDGEELCLGCSGDGVLCLQTRAGALDVYSISYPSGYPLYPSYAHQPERLRALKEGGRAGKEIRHYHSASAAEPLQLLGATGGGAPTEVFSFRAADYQCAALFSDGLHTFFHAREKEAGARAEPVPLDAVVRDLISFKHPRGAFVARRVRMFLRDCQRRGWQHADDLAAGALHLGG